MPTDNHPLSRLQPRRDYGQVLVGARSFHRARFGCILRGDNIDVLALLARLIAKGVVSDEEDGDD